MSMSGLRSSRRASRFGEEPHNWASGLSGAAVMAFRSRLRHSGASRNPEQPMRRLRPWILAFAGMTPAVDKLHPAFAGDLVGRLVDGGDLLGGDCDEVLRHAAGHQLVWMIFG